MPNAGSRRTRKTPLGAFTRTELLILLGSGVILFAVSLPMLAVFPSRELRAVCANNLRMAGVAFHAWANDHGDNVPWLIHPSQGGSRGNQIASAHWQMLHGYLEDPTALACPASPRKPSADFATLRDANVSYLIGSDADLAQPSTILSGDLGIEGGTTEICSFVGHALVQSFPGQFGVPNSYNAVSWSLTNHFRQGNLLTADGAVFSTDSFGLRRVFSRSTDIGNNCHVLVPR